MATAAAILAMIDGLALVAVTIGDERAAKAAAHMVAIAGGGELCKD
jgi:hypothetical protein